MRRKILLSGLTLALFVAGFAVATWPAVAELRTITVTLVGGQEIVTTVDVPPSELEPLARLFAASPK